MSTADFLLARIAEDQAAARDLPPEEGALALLATVRRIVWDLIPLAAEEGWDQQQCHATLLIRKFAATYSDHPDYRQEWKPW